MWKLQAAAMFLFGFHLEFHSNTKLFPGETFISKKCDNAKVEGDFKGDWSYKSKLQKEEHHDPGNIQSVPVVAEITQALCLEG